MEDNQSFGGSRNTEDLVGSEKHEKGESLKNPLNEGVKRPSKYIERECLGHFIQKGCDLQPLVGKAGDPFKTFLDFDVIKKINSGTPLSCDKSYHEYTPETPEKARDAHSVEILENYLKKTGLEGKKVIVSRTKCLTALFYPVLTESSTNTKSISYWLNEKGWLLLEETDPYLPIKNWEKRDTGSISHELILKDNAFNKENPVLHDSQMFRVMKHQFEQFQLISATKVDALWNETKESTCVAIMKRKKDQFIDEEKATLIYKLLGGINQLVVPVINEKKLIEEKECPSLFSEFFEWFSEFVKETKCSSGELHVSGAGIVAHSEEHYAIFTKYHPERRYVYKHSVKPRIYFSELAFNSPFVNRDACFIFRELNKSASFPKRCPTINYAQWSNELEDVPETDFVFAQKRKGDKSCQIADYSVMIHFLRSINRDIVISRSPQKPVVAISPHYYRIPMDRFLFLLATDEPWTCSLTQENIIVAQKLLRNLQTILSYHEWHSEMIPIKLTVVLILCSVSEEVIRSILRSTFCEETVNNCHIKVFRTLSDGKEAIRILPGGAVKELYLVDENSSVVNNSTYDVQLIDDFLQNGLSRYRKRPGLIYVYGSEKQYQEIHSKTQERNLQIRVRRGLKK